MSQDQDLTPDGISEVAAQAAADAMALAIQTSLKSTDGGPAGLFFSGGNFQVLVEMAARLYQHEMIYIDK
jgi:hypothetical protein